MAPLPVIGTATLRPAEEQPVADDRQSRGHHQRRHLFKAFDHRGASTVDAPQSDRSV